MRKSVSIYNNISSNNYVFKLILILNCITASVTSVTYGAPTPTATKKENTATTPKNNSAKQNNSKPNHCVNYKALTSVDRQVISDTRYALELIKPDMNENEINHKLQIVLNKYSPYFKREPLPNHLQGLIAEFFLKRLIYKSIGVNNLAYKKFTIFIDLILYHRAMNHLGVVNEVEFAMAKKNLEQEVINYYKEPQKQILKTFQQERTQVLTALSKNNAINPTLIEKANKYIEIENTQAQMLGSIELIWAQLLNRNQQNRMESMANSAVIDLTVNTAVAATGLAAMVRVALGMTMTATTGAYGIISTANSLWSISLQAAIGCGIGLTAKTTVGTFSSSYLDAAKALYASLQNKTSFACELGEMVNKSSTSSAKEVVIPDAKPPSTLSDYLITCATGAVMRLFPTTAGIAVDGVILASLAQISYNLANEAFVVIKEVPRLHDLKAKAQAASGNAEELMLIQEKIDTSEAKIALYLSAMGNNTVLAIRNGFFLYLHRGNISQVVTNARNFLTTQSSKVISASSPDLTTLKFVVDKLN